jgi:hypothetical protein
MRQQIPAWRITLWGSLTWLLMLVVLLHFSSAKAAGAIAHVSWTHPTQYITTDPVTGQTTTTTLPLSDIKQTIIKWYVGTTLVGSTTVQAPATTVDVPNLVCGNYNFVGVTVVNSGASSVDSAPPAIYVTGLSCTTPKPPAVTVQ